MRHYDTLGLPPGYRLDLVRDPCVMSLCRSDGTVVACFSHAGDLKEIRRAAEEDGGEGAEAEQ